MPSRCVCFGRASARTCPAVMCVPRHAAGLRRVLCVCAAGAVSGDKIPIVAKKKEKARRRRAERAELAAGAL